MSKANFSIKQFLFFFSLILLLFAIFVYQGIYIPKDSESKEEVLFLIKKGESLSQIAKNLEEKGLIRNKTLMEWYIFLKGKEKNIIAGEYNLSPSMSLKEIVDKICSGEVVHIKITIPEGWNLRDIAFYFENKGMFQAEEFWQVAGFPAVDYNKALDLPKPQDFSGEFTFLQDKPTNIGLEGYLFPDTYFIQKSATPEDIVRVFLENFDQKLTSDLRQEIQRQGKTIFEIVTMASLLEKEVKTKEDKEIVSGILWKRLKYKIPLQVDATITYITGKKSTKVSIVDTQIDSPYNTYKYKGLPIGPICNPGMESILAAIYPKKSDYWYYLSTPDGKTLFSRTLEEHNIKKAKYLK